MIAFESVLRGGGGKGRFHDREIEALEDFNFRAKERDWSVGRPLIRRLPWFGNRNHLSRLPDSRNICRPHRQVEEVCEILDSQRPQMFKMKHCDAVRTRSRRVFARLDSVDCVGSRERSVVPIQRVVDFHIFMDFTSFFILLKGLNIGILLTKIIGYGGSFSDSFVFKDDRLVWRNGGSLP